MTSEPRFMELTFSQLIDLINKYKLPIYDTENLCPICIKFTCDECEICPACHERKLFDVLEEVFKYWADGHVIKGSIAHKRVDDYQSRPND